MACHPTGMLRDEHRLILRVIAAFEALLDAGAEAAPAPDLRACADFFRLYTDRLHHGKEEDVLFQALVEEGFPLQAGPLAVMLEEHQQGRSLARQIADAVEALAARAGAWRDIERPGRAYIELIRHHIGREDDGIFETADRALPEPACRAVCHAYEEVCSRRFEGRTTEDLERLAADLIDRYGRG